MAVCVCKCHVLGAMETTLMELNQQEQRDGRLLVLERTHVGYLSRLFTASVSNNALTAVTGHSSVVLSPGPPS